MTSGETTTKPKRAEERIVAALRALGPDETLTIEQIAERCQVSVGSVKVHITNIRKKWLAPHERIPYAATGRGAAAAYCLNRESSIPPP
jgi:DNA-binding NarL/FixJ family response regulator